MSKKSKKPRPLNARAKGKNYERKIGKRLCAWWGIPWDNPGKLFHPTPMSGGFVRPRSADDLLQEARVAGLEFPEWGGDIIVPQDFPFSVECKNRQGWEFRDLIHGRRFRGNSTQDRDSLPVEWMDQAERARAGRHPMLVFTRRQWEDYVLLPLEAVGFIEERVGKVRDLARFAPYGNRLYILDQILELDPDALGRRREQR